MSSKVLKEVERRRKPSRRASYGRIVFLCIATVLLSCFLPMYLLYLSNLSEMTFLSILKPVGISMAVGICFFLLSCYGLHKSLTFSCMLSSCTMLLLLNVGAINKLLRKIVSPIIALLLTIAMVAVFIALLWKFCSFVQNKGLLRKAVVILLITVIGLVTLNTIPVAGQVQSKVIAAISATTPPEATSLPENREVALSKELVPEETPLSEVMPNIYYFILDEYASFDVIDKYYGYDNSSFQNYLNEMQFNVSQDSKCITPTTQLCVADIVTLNYLPEDSRTLADAKKSLSNALLYTELRGLGYSLYQMSTGTYIFRGIPSLRDESLFVTGEPETEDGATVTDIARDQSILAILNGIGSQSQGTSAETQPEEVELLSTEEIMDLARHRYSGNISNRLSVFDYFEDASAFANADKAVIFSYICCPHVPFIFQANGAPVEAGHYADWQNTQYYLGQYRYVTARMKNIIQAIITENPNCMIIIQSDHGVRWHENCSQPHTFEITEDDECRILNAVYCCGRKMNIEGLSATNTIRLLLSEYGLNYPQLS